MLGELLPTGGGDPIPFLKTKLLVGRRESCDISLRFPNVSSHHCELELINGYWRVRDLGSRNGTKVNGIRVESTWLLPGDELSVAKHSYEVKYAANLEAPPPEIEEAFSMSLLEKAGLRKREKSPDPTPVEPPTQITENTRLPLRSNGSNNVTPPQPFRGNELSDEDAALFFLSDVEPTAADHPNGKKHSAGMDGTNGSAPAVRRDLPPAPRSRNLPPR